MRPTIRPATRADLAGAMGMLRALVEEQAALGGDPLGSGPEAWAELEARLERELFDPGACLRVAEVEGARAGFAEARVEELGGVLRPRRLLHLSALYVEPGWRRRGLGRALAEACLSWGEERGLPAARLHVLAAHPARSLYAALGFAPHRIEMRRGLGSAAPDAG